MLLFSRTIKDDLVLLFSIFFLALIENEEEAMNSELKETSSEDSEEEITTAQTKSRVQTHSKSTKMKSKQSEKRDQPSTSSKGRPNKQTLPKNLNVKSRTKIQSNTQLNNRVRNITEQEFFTLPIDDTTPLEKVIDFRNNVNSKVEELLKRKEMEKKSNDSLELESLTISKKRKSQELAKETMGEPIELDEEDSGMLCKKSIIFLLKNSNLLFRSTFLNNFYLQYVDNFSILTAFFKTFFEKNK